MSRNFLDLFGSILTKKQTDDYTRLQNEYISNIADLKNECSEMMGDIQEYRELFDLVEYFLYRSYIKLEDNILTIDGTIHLNEEQLKLVKEFICDRPDLLYDETEGVIND